MSDFLTCEISKIGKEKLVANKKLIIAGGDTRKVKEWYVSLVKCVRTWRIYSWTKRRRIPDYSSTPNMQCAQRQGSSYSLPILMCWSCVLHTSDISHEELWFRTGVRDRHRYVPVHLTCQKLGQKLCKALPAFHALTGCDTTSVIAGVGKKKAWEVL